jgi:hypothetical protein
LLEENSHDRAMKEKTMTMPYLLNEFALAIVELAANLLLRATGGPVQLPRSNEDFALY